MDALTTRRPAGEALLATKRASAGRIPHGPKDQRSAVTNGRRLHVIAPGDTKWSRRFRDILSEILSDLGHAGLSEGQRQIARRCATIAIACEKMEGEAAAGNDIDLDAYGTLTDRLGRAFSRLGLKRQSREVSTTLGDLRRLDLQQQRKDDQA